MMCTLRFRLALICLLVAILTRKQNVLAQGEGEKFELLKQIVREVVRDQGSLEDDTSPQHRAVTWLSTQDKRTRIPIDGEETIQRFVLVTLYFSTHGEFWLKSHNFLSELDVCDWNGEIDIDTGEMQGVECDASGRVTDLALVNNGLSGEVPPEISALSLLSSLKLSTNILEGSLQSELGRLSNLEYLQLQSNEFIGRVPFTFTKLEKLALLWVQNNKLTGTADFLCESLDRVMLKVDLPEVTCGCCVCCTPPPSPSPVDPDGRMNAARAIAETLSDRSALDDEGSPQFRALQWLVNVDEAAIDVGDEGRVSQRYILAVLYYSTGGENWLQSYNFLTSRHECEWNGDSGSETDPVDGVEECVGDRITVIDMNTNGLIGPLPPEIGFLTSLTKLWLWGNSFLGPIPSSLGNLAELERLSLRRNNFVSPLPREISGASSLKYLDLSQNELYLSIPPELSSLTHLQTLDLSDNSFIGEVPGSLTKLTALKRLSLDNNELGGDVEFLCDKLNGTTIAVELQKVGCTCCSCCKY